MKEIIIYITKLGNINENLISKEQLERVKTYRSKKARVESLSGTTLLMEVLLEKSLKILALLIINLVSPIYLTVFKINTDFV